MSQDTESDHVGTGSSVEVVVGVCDIHFCLPRKIKNKVFDWP